MSEQSGPTSGALSPSETSKAVLATGEHHLNEALQLTFIKNIYGAMLLSSAGLLALLLSTGVPSVTASNPAAGQLLFGTVWPLGLVMVYLSGAELFTGYPMWYTLTALRRKGRPMSYVAGGISSWLGNLLGGFVFAAVFSVASGVVTEEPFASGVRQMMAEDVIEMAWWRILIKAVACGFLVTVAMVFGTQAHDMVSKAVGLYIPFFLAACIKLPHTVEYMYMGAVAVLLGHSLSFGQYLWRCLLPITLGNIIGGSLFTGLYLWWVFLVCNDESAGLGPSTNKGRISLGDED